MTLNDKLRRRRPVIWLLVSIILTLELVECAYDCITHRINLSVIHFYSSNRLFQKPWLIGGVILDISSPVNDEKREEAEKVMMMSPGTHHPGRRRGRRNSFKLKIAIRSVSAHISLHPLYISSCEAQDTRKSGVRRRMCKHRKPVLVFVESDATHCSPCVANIINIPCKLECFLLPQVCACHSERLVFLS